MERRFWVVLMLMLLGLGCAMPRTGYWEPMSPSDPPDDSLVVANLSCAEQHGTGPPWFPPPTPLFEEFESIDTQERQANLHAQRSWETQSRDCMQMKGWVWVDEPRMYRP